MNPYLIASYWGWFAEGRFLGKVLDEWNLDTQEFVRTRLPHLIVVALVALVLTKVLKVITHHVERAAESHAAGQSRASEIKTLAGVIRATGLAIIGIIAGLQFLDALGVNLGPLLASAGIAGIAIGLAAQNIVRDVLNGILILIESQFHMGDTVRLAGVSGVVEEMTLRRTAIRDSDGTLYVIPNSQISTVANLSVDYSLATINVSTDFSADPDLVVRLLRETAMAVRQSEAFRDVFVDDPKVLGVDAVKGSQLVFPVQFKTRPTQQYAPMREFLRQVRLSFKKHGVLPGDPNRVFRVFGEQNNVAPAVQEQSVEESTAVHDPTAARPNEGNPFSAK